jgi:hypothetical protein
MIWDSSDFRSVYNRELHAAVLALESEARTLEQKFHVDVGRAGVISGVHLAHAAGGIASAVLSGYVTKALAAFDHAIATTGARAQESDLEELRRSIESDLARRLDSLPTRLAAMLKHDAGGVVWKTIANQSPQNARGLLGRRIENDLAGIRFRSRTTVVPAREVFISHAVDDGALALALKSALVENLGQDVEVFVSSDLRSIPGGANPTERILAAIKSNPITIAVVTPNFIRSRWLYFETGIAEGANQLVIVLNLKKAISIHEIGHEFSMGDSLLFGALMDKDQVCSQAMQSHLNDLNWSGGSLKLIMTTRKPGRVSH